jgi:hypothetical protein
LRLERERDPNCHKRRLFPGLANSKSTVPRTTPPFDSVFFTRLIGIFLFGSCCTIAWLHLASRKGAVAIEFGAKAMAIEHCAIDKGAGGDLGIVRHHRKLRPVALLLRTRSRSHANLSRPRSAETARKIHFEGWLRRL